MLFNIGTINWKDSTQNLIIAAVCFLIGGLVGYQSSRMTSKDVIEQLKPTIEKAIDKESITNTIHNAIDLKIDKIKKSDSLNIVVNQKPINNQKPENVIVTPRKKENEKKKKWWKFWKKK